MFHHPTAEPKCWGQTTEVFYSRGCSVHYLKVDRGWRCSRHLHDERANRFYVISGCVVVRIYGADERIATLQPGDVFDVPSGVLHRFEVVESGELLEVYWPDIPGGVVRRDDITRQDEGGRMEDSGAEAATALPGCARASAR